MPQMMSGDILKDYVSLVVDLVNDGVPVMIYAGEQDLICNWLGNQR
jgi:cathepsin A (carboxypeptidase C)